MHHSGGLGNNSSIKSLHRGNVVWLTLPQSLAPMSQASTQPTKPRPFIVLSDRVTYETDRNGQTLRPFQLIGADGTSQYHLVEGRPHMSFQMANGRTTYALLDSVRTVTARDPFIRVSYRFTPAEQQSLHQELGKVLQPEREFFLRKLFARACMPGQVWRIQTVNAELDAMVLLRRGRFMLPQDQNNTHDVVHHTPYLVATFNAGALTLHGIRPEDSEIMAVHERSFMHKSGELSPRTVEVVLNDLRRRVGLSPIAYKQPPIQSALSVLGLLVQARGFRFIR